MPAFLVELPQEPGHYLVGGFNKMVVFAADSASAIDAAQGQFSLPRGADAMWAGATATQLAAASNLVGADGEWDLHVAIEDATTPVEVFARGGAGNDAVASGVVNAGGSGYVVDDIVTVAGGTFTRAATLRVVTAPAGALGTVEVVDPGEYTVAPSLTANAVTGGTGSSGTVDLTMAGENSYEVLLGQVVGLLNATAEVAGAAVDMSEGASGARLLTCSGAGDNLGDNVLVAEFRRNGAPNASLASTITDEGVAGSALTMAIPASPLTYPSVTPVKG